MEYESTVALLKRKPNNRRAAPTATDANNKSRRLTRLCDTFFLAGEAANTASMSFQFSALRAVLPSDPIIYRYITDRTDMNISGGDLIDQASVSRVLLNDDQLRGLELDHRQCRFPILLCYSDRTPPQQATRIPSSSQEVDAAASLREGKNEIVRGAIMLDHFDKTLSQFRLSSFYEYSAS